MRHEPLTGYVLHARPYQEKRAIYQLFSREWGVVHGVGSRGVPTFVPIELFATGKNALKTFSQIHPKGSTSLSVGQSQYALWYLNELIVKLIAPENPCPTLWRCYHDSLSSITPELSLDTLKRQLRHFENALFDELGVGIDWEHDGAGVEILPDKHYDYLPNQGFALSKTGVLGEMLLIIANNSKEHLSTEQLNITGQIHRKLIDDLLGHQPLNSRALWLNWLKYNQT